MNRSIRPELHSSPQPIPPLQWRYAAQVALPTNGIYADVVGSYDPNRKVGAWAANINLPGGQTLDTLNGDVGFASSWECYLRAICNCVLWGNDNSKHVHIRIPDAGIVDTLTKYMECGVNADSKLLGLWSYLLEFRDTFSFEHVTGPSKDIATRARASLKRMRSKKKTPKRPSYLPKTPKHPNVGSYVH